MWIASFNYDLWPRPWSKRKSSPPDASDRTARFGNRGRSAVPWHERLLLTGLLLVVTGWIVLRLVLALAAH